MSITVLIFVYLAGVFTFGAFLYRYGSRVEEPKDATVKFIISSVWPILTPMVVVGLLIFLFHLLMKNIPRADG